MKDLSEESVSSVEVVEIMSIIEESLSLVRSNPLRAIYLYDKAIEISKKTNTYFFLYKTLSHLGIAIYGISFEYSKLSKRDKERVRTYIIRDTHTLNVKIGRSTNPYFRLNQLKVANPNLQMVCISNKNCELEIHRLYKKYKVGREWFQIPESEIKKIINQFNFIVE